MPDSLSLAQARRIALAAQGFGAPRPIAAGTRQISALVDRIGLLQIDSVNVFERSHYLPVFARLGGYDKALLDRMTLRPRARYIEYWAHEAAFLRASDRPLFHWRMEDYRARIERRDPAWFAASRTTLDRLRAELAERGPLPASRIERERARPRSGWWDWDEVKRGLERMFAAGELVAAGRQGFERVYALPEQVLPAQLLDIAVPREEAIRELLRRAARAHGVGTVSDLADYYRLPAADARRAAAELVEAGELLPVAVEGWRQPALLHPDARIPRSIAATALLSPFDPVVWERNRTLRLFGFHYRIEIYTPAAQRVYGYYTLPALVDDALVGRVDLKNDRQAGVLRVRAAWREAQAPPDIAERIAAELRAAASWQGLERIEVEERGNLAPGLRDAIA